MGLSPEQIKALLAKPEKSKGRKKSAIDTTDRTYQTWFKLAPRAFGENLSERLSCDNPDCLDTRPPVKTAMGEEVKIQFTADIDGIRMCRRCFLAGYGLSDSTQEQLTV